MVKNYLEQMNPIDPSYLTAFRIYTNVLNIFQVAIFFILFNMI